MMLNGQFGCTFTGRGFAPTGASQSCNDGWLEPSMKMRRAGVSKAGATASTNRCAAPLSATIPANCAGREPVGIGATAAPARNAPRNTAAYSSELAAQIAMRCCGRTPSRCNDAATRSTMASSWPQVTLRPPCTSARWPGRAAACWRTRSAMAWNGGVAVTGCRTAFMERLLPRILPDEEVLVLRVALDELGDEFAGGHDQQVLPTRVVQCKAGQLRAQALPFVAGQHFGVHELPLVGPGTVVGMSGEHPTDLEFVTLLRRVLPDGDVLGITVHERLR